MSEHDSWEWVIKKISALLALLTIVIVLISAGYLWVVSIALTRMISDGLAVLVGLSVIPLGFVAWFGFFIAFYYLTGRYTRLIQDLRGGPAWYRSPTDLALFPPDRRDIALQVKTRIEARFKAEADSLKALGITVPECSQDVSFKVVADEKSREQGKYYVAGMQVQFPVFRRPDSFYFCLLQSGEPNQDHGVGYFVMGSSKAVEAAIADFKEDPETAVGKHSGVWVNRSPYKLYDRLTGHTFDIGWGFQYGAIDRVSRLLDPPDLAPLQPAKPLTSAEVGDILVRMSLFRAVAKSTGLPDPGPPIPTWLSPSVAYGVPVGPAGLGEGSILLKIVLGQSAGLSACKGFWESLRGLKNSVAFDLLADNSGMYFRLLVSPADQEFVVNRLQIHFPDFAVIPNNPGLEPSEPLHMMEVSPDSVFRCLKPLRQLSVDPYAPLVKLLDDLPLESFFCFRVLASPLKDEALQVIAQEFERLSDKAVLLELQKQWGWRPQGGRAEYLADEAEELRRNLKNRVGELQEKLPGWIASASIYCTNEGLLSDLGRNWLAQYETPDQKFLPLKVTKASQMEAEFKRCTLWNSDELAAMAHFPDSEVESERLERTTNKMKAPPQIMTGEGATIGINEYRGKETTVLLPDRYRDRHLYIIGKTRTGKSTLMLNMVVQDIQAGRGVGVIDPHGDLVEDILHYVPQSRIVDTILWDASERSRPIGINIMEVHTDEEIGIMADDLLISFRRLSESWGDRMENLLRYIFHTLLSCEGTTFFDVQRILLNEEFRESVVSQLDDPALIEFWLSHFKFFSRDALQPILSRMSKFILSPALSAALGQRESSLYLFDVIQNRRILLVNLAQGKIGEDSAKLLGSLVVSQIQLAAMRRAKVRREAREPFYLYVDEFQNFTTSAFDKILSEAGKYKLCLTLAHQYISQLEDKIRNAILGNAGTLMMFPSSAQDARCLKAELGSYDVEDLTDLSTQEHEALCRPPTKSSDTFKLRTLPPPQKPTESLAREVVESSLSTYGRPSQVRPVRPSATELKPSEAAGPQAPQSTATPRTTATPAEKGTVPRAHREPAVQPEPVSGGPQAKTLPVEPSPGRGGMEHKSLQYLIRNLGQSFGYQATIEKQILGGAGSVDVALEKDDLSIACQVCVTTGAEYEVKSIQKCLEAGFTAVVLISNSRKTLNKARDLLADAVPPEAESRVRLLAFEDLNAFLAELKAAGETRTETVRGRKVTVSYKAVPKEEQELRSQAIYQVVANSFRRLGRMQPE